ncbi:hypothetical protein CK247_30945, partial [Klebsiella pneumoniae]
GPAQRLVVMQASGFTRLQVALAVMKTAIPLVLRLAGAGDAGPAQRLVVMQASGFTRLQVALAVMKTAIPLVL